MSPLGRSRGQQPLCLKFLFTIGFENAAINKQVRRKENATKDKGKCNQGQTREDVEEHKSFELTAYEMKVGEWRGTFVFDWIARWQLISFVLTGLAD